MSPPKVLFVLTSHGKMGALDKPTGWYLVHSPAHLLFIANILQPEFAHPYEVLSSQCEIVVASPLGGESPLDPSSVEAFKGDAVSAKFLKHSEALWKNTHKLSEFVGKAGDFEAIFFVGGHGRTLPRHFDRNGV
jgi:putative intracellular protease/amidase